MDNGDTAPYLMRSKTQVSNEEEPITLTIQGGVQMQGTSWGGYSCGSSQLEIGKNAALKISGTSRKPVLFTSQSLEDKDQDPWGKIIIKDDARTSETVIKFAILEYGAADTYDVAGVCNNRNWEMLDIKNGSPEISYSTFRYSSEDGLYIDENALPVISHCKFLENNDDGVTLENPASGLNFESCEFINNSDYAIQNENEDACVDATGCFWGDPSGPQDDSQEIDCANLYSPNATGDNVTDGVIYSNWSQVGDISIPDEPDDTDLDGIPDLWDECPNTPMYTAVYDTGCPADDLYDHVSDKDKTILELENTIETMHTEQDNLYDNISDKDKTIQVLENTMKTMYTEQEYVKAMQSCDINNDGKIGLAEAIHALKIAAAMK